MKPLDLGVIVILDILGFKGIWTRQDARNVLDRMKSLRRNARSLQGKDRAGVLLIDSGFRHRIRCMSDTLVITVIVKGPKAPKRALYRAMLSASVIATHIVMDGLYGTPPFLFRGCIAAGEMKEDVDFLIGPAVDEAAEGFESADGPFLWMTKSALQISSRFRDTYGDRIEPTVMSPYVVPMKDGGTFETTAFTYCALTQEQTQWAQTKRKLLDAFGETKLKLDVKRKKQNLIKFLAHIENLAATGDWMKEPQQFRAPDWGDLSLNQKIAIINAGLLDRYVDKLDFEAD